MFIELMSLLLAIVLPIVTKVPLAIAMYQNNGYNNRYPRQQQSQLAGWGARAKASHENAFEAAILFTPVMVLVIALELNSTLIQSGAIIWMGARLAYHLFYLLDWHWWRSVCWGLGFTSNLAILLSIMTMVLGW